MAKQARATSCAQAPPYDGSVYVHEDISQTRSHNLQFKYPETLQDITDGQNSVL